MSAQAKKEIISGFPCHYLSREIVLCYDSCYIFLYMEHVMVHVSCSAGRRGSCIYALRRVRAPRAAGLQPLIEQGCATRGGWRTLYWLQSKGADVALDRGPNEVALTNARDATRRL